MSEKAKRSPDFSAMPGGIAIPTIIGNVTDNLKNGNHIYKPGRTDFLAQI